MEAYKLVQDDRFPNIYEVSNKGNVKLLRSNKITKGSINNYGYKFITGKFNKYRTTLLVHRLVANAFIPNPNNLPYINHKDGNKENNNVENLEWCTHSENMKHAVKIGLVTNCTKKGEQHNASKLTNRQVLSIREDYKNKVGSMRYLANKYKCSVGSISDIINNKTRV